MDTNNNQKNQSTAGAGIASAAYETVSKYGSAVKEHLSAYSGFDNETKTELAKGLKAISDYKVNDSYKASNIKQQAGFSAEVKTAARENAEKIIKGEKSKVVRTDDIAKQSDYKGNTIGGKNDQLYDIAEINQNGVYIEGTAHQLKYIGGSADDCAKKLLSSKFDKYRNAGTQLEIPADFYDDVKKELAARAERARSQLVNAEKRGDASLANKHKQRLNTIEKTQKALTKGKLTSEEAIQARLHPAWSTAKDITKLSHEAGIEGTTIGAAVGGGVSFIQNTVAVIKGDKKITEALMGVTTDTVSAGVAGYITNFGGTAIKGAMQNAPSKFLSSLSKTNIPSTIVVSALEIGKTLSHYGNGKINGKECITELGEKSSGMLGATIGSTVGQTVIPAPIIGALVGSMVGYALFSAYYNNLFTLFKDAKTAREERIAIEKECSECIKNLQEYRLQIELISFNYLKENISVFQSSFYEMEQAYELCNANKFIANANKITRQLGGNPCFETKEEFDSLMMQHNTIKI